MREVAIKETFCIKIPGAISGINPSAKAPGTIFGTTASLPIAVVPGIVPAVSLEMVIVPEIVPGLLMENFLCRELRLRVSGWIPLCRKLCPRSLAEGRHCAWSLVPDLRDIY